MLAHATRLTWSDDMLKAHVLTDLDFQFPAQSQRHRKELLYIKIIENFELGKNWENAISLCKELALQVLFF